MRVWTLLLLLTCVPLGISEAKSISWPEAVDLLARERPKAETCVAMLKRYGDSKQIARLQLAYNRAKADFDGVIAGLEAALAEGGNPESLSELKTELESGERGLKAFCNSVQDLLPSKGFSAEVVKLWIEPLEKIIETLSKGVAALYENHRDDDAATRQAIRVLLEHARWPEFAEPPCSSAREVAAAPLVKTLADMANELNAVPFKERIRREEALQEARISLMHEGWRPEWGDYGDFLRWVTEQGARDPPPASAAMAAAIYRGQAK